ncbi:tyrosine recombinase XerC [Peptoniphilus sp. oral taxon 386]|uniref:tyrosine recombinase XerC n=1 Tax=Peptoniphilus sp. oral taxon 386 TaxID=652713 RepID=UPI0002ECAF97|nr:tyrosine recombinase XerC [Peptoniphilus sp. oral taxon 386]
MINSNIVDDFLSYLSTTKGASQTTIKEYYYDIRIFLNFIFVRKGIIDEKSINEIDIDAINIDILKSINKMDIYAYNSYLDKIRKNSNKTKYRKISSIRTFFNYLSNKIDVIEFNPIEDIDMPKIEKRLPIYLTLEESKLLLKTVSESKIKDKYKTRDYAIVVLFLNCGMRLSELSGLNIKDVNNDNTLRVTGKGNKERTIYLNNACVNALKNYLNYRNDTDNKALFLSNRNTRLSNRQIQRMVEKYINASGLDSEKYTVHKLRHTAASLMYQYGDADIRSLQEILGHESVTTTQIYTHINDKQLKNTVDNNPLSNIDFDNK